MVQVRKFSQFPAGTLTEAVGLAAGANTRGPTGGGGGGGSVTHTFPQQAPLVQLGDWLKVEAGSGLYKPGQGDNAADAEIIGICIAATATTFTVQQAGYIATGSGIPGIIGLTAGDVYFIDTATQGAMVPVDAAINGQVSRPVFLADGADSGWVLPYRGAIVGGSAPSSGGGGGGTDSSIHVVNQPLHGFVPGDVLRIDTTGATIQYAKALADTLANAQAVGVVCANPAPTANQFSLQESGYNIGSITMDDVPANVTAKTIYYLSPTAAGRVTSINPAQIGQISRPIYACEQGVANAGVNAGWIFPQRPLDLSQIVPPIHTVNGNPHGFVNGQWVYIDGDASYNLAKADNFATAQVAGVVVNATAGGFAVQQSGWCNGVVTGAFIDTGAPVSGQVLYLSDLNAGNLTSIVPAVIGRYHKPCYVQETAVGRVGEILPQKPTIIAAPTPLFPGNVAAAANFSATGGIINIRSSFNVASIVRTAAGHYTVNFAVPMANANYYFLTQAGNVDGANWWGQGPGAVGSDPTVNSFKFVTGSGGSFVDAKWITVMIWSA